MEISKIDVLVYPVWSGGYGTMIGEGVYPPTGIKITRSRWASKAKLNRWKKYADEVAGDESRLMFIVQEKGVVVPDNGNIVNYSLGAIGERCFLVDDKKIEAEKGKARELEVLAGMVEEKGYSIPDPVDNSAYGHHRGDCVIRIGQAVLDSLGLENTELHQDWHASVTDQRALIMETVKKYNPELHAELTANNGTSGKYDWLFLRNLPEYLMFTKTPRAIKHLVRGVKDVGELIEKIDLDYLPGRGMVDLLGSMSDQLRK